MMLKPFGILALLSICVYSAYYLLTQYYLQTDVQVKPSIERPLFTGTHVKSTNYNDQGIRSYELNSVHLEHYQQLDETHFSEPVLWTYREGIEQKWRVSSDFAVLKSNRILNMTGHVKIFNLLPDAQIKIINTEKLTLDLVTQDFWSNTPTDISGIGFRTQGERVKGNFGSHQMELIEQVNSTYETKIK